MRKSPLSVPSIKDAARVFIHPPLDRRRVGRRYPGAIPPGAFRQIIRSAPPSLWWRRSRLAPQGCGIHERGVDQGAGRMSWLAKNLTTVS